MAKRDKITYLSGSTPITETCVNLTFSVGVGGDNGPADIMLIQTIFNYIGVPRTRPISPVTGLSARDMPAITGRMDAKTQSAIYAFQRAHQGRVISIDGKVESAKYAGRVISKLAGRLMTITWLDFRVRDEALMRNEPDHVAALQKDRNRLRLNRRGIVVACLLHATERGFGEP